MSKRILSLVLCLSLLLTCLSGLTLIASGDETDTPNYVYVDMTTADWSGSVNATQIHTNGATAFDAEAGAWKYCETNAGVHFTVPNCGLSSNAIAVTVKYNLPTDYVDDNTRWTIHIGDTFYYLRAVGWANDFGNQLVNGYGDNLVRGEDATYTFIVTGADAATLAAGTNLQTYMWGANAPENEHFYIKSITIKSVDYAKVDFSTGTMVGTNASLRYNHSAEDAQNGKGEMEDVGTLNSEGLVEMADGAYAMALYEQNRGFGVQVENFGLTGTEDVAVTVEYYIPEGVAQDSTRYNMVIADKNYTLRVGGSGDNTNNAAMTIGRWAASTFIVSGEAAAKFGEDSFQMTTCCWNHNNSGYNNEDWGGDYYYIRSISFMAASKLNEPEDPGYDYYDFVNKVAVNPNYPDYKQDDVLNMVWSLNNGEGNGKVTDKGMEMTSGTLYFNSTRAMNQSDVAVRLYFAEGTTGNITFQYNADAEKNPDYTGNIDFKTLEPSPEVDENGVVTVIPTDAKFAGKQQNIYSFRIYADGKTLERVEVYVLGKKTELQAAVDGEITDLSIYSKDSAKAYTDALNAAKAVLAQDIATQKELDAALKTLTTARDSLKQTVFTLPNPNWTNKDEETNPLVSTFEEKQCLSWVSGGAWSYNGGSIMTALGLTEGQIADLKIKLTVYWQSVNGDGDWWHFNTLNEDGTSAPSLSGTPNDSGFGGFKDYGMVPNAWSNITIERERQQLNAEVDNLFVNVGGLAEGNALYIAGMLYQATLEDGTVLTGIWGEMMPDPVVKTALEEAVNAEIDYDAYTADSVEAYKTALEAAKAVLEDDEASQDDVDAAVAALKAAKDALKELPPQYAEINFADDKVNTVNGAIQHNHPDEDDGDADNGIYKVAEDVDAYGAKLSVQNHGFGFGIDTSKCDWIAADAKLDLVVTYYAPADKVQDNSRIGYSFDASGYSPLLYGKDMTKDEVTTFTYTLTAEEVNKVVANKLFHLLFWNYADDPSNGDEVYVLSVRLQPHKVVAGDTAALKAAVAAAEELSADLYTADSFKALTDALTAAKALLETTATQDDLDAAAAALAKAVEGLVMDSWDLVVESVTTDKGMNIKVGEAVKFTLVIKNVGTKAIPEGGKYGAVIKVNGETAAWSDNYKTTDTAAALEPGQTMTLTTCGGPNGADGSWKSDEVGEFTILAFVNDNEADGIQNELDRDNNTLETTLKVSEEGVKVDDLKTEISKVDEMELDKYTEESVKAVEDALAAAKAVLSDANATQTDIDKALADLAAAIAKLEESEPTEVLYGDANGDGKITTADAALVLQYAAELIKDDALNLAAADVNGDGKVTTADAALILQYAAELIKEFPAASK